MRAISPHGRYSLQLIEAPVKRGTDSQGTVVEYSDTKPVIAHFEKLGLTDDEQLAALEHFSFSGLPDGVNPLSTISVWDSEGQALAHGWDEEFTAKVDARLEYLANMNPASVMVVKRELKQAPWATYDGMEPKAIFETMLLTGFAPEPVRLYEAENQDRPEVIDVLEQLQAGDVAITDVVDSFSDREVGEDEPAYFVPPNYDGLEQAQITHAHIEFPVVKSPGRWTLSDGSTFAGKKIEAQAAEAALPKGGEVVVTA